MERIRSLGRYQKGVLLIVITMILVFTVIYPIISAREGFAYKGTILIPNQENGNTIYSGKIQGKQARFFVYEDKTVEFQYGDKTYGPYTAKEDQTAIPKDLEMREEMTGVELRQGEKILFRGGVENNGDVRLLFNEDGSIEDISISARTDDGIESDGNGNVNDPVEPPVSAILDLMAGPELTNKGEWYAWFVGVFLCFVTAISILFTDKLFRWNLIFLIRNADQAEPSGWEIIRRHVVWTIFPIIAMIVFIAGLQ